MNGSSAQQRKRSKVAYSSAANPRLTGRQLILARTAWVMLVIPSLGLFIASLPVYYAQIQRV